MPKQFEDRFFGEFEIKSGTVVVSDPCYSRDVWCMGELKNVKPGMWEAKAEMSDENDWGTRVAYLKAVLKSHDIADRVVSWEEPDFTVGVDSGQAGIFDADFYRTQQPGGIEIVYGDEDDCNFYDACCQLTLGVDSGGSLEHGCVSSSGYGDGAYHCYVGRNSDGQVVQIEIDFGLDRDEDEDL